MPTENQEQLLAEPPTGSQELKSAGTLTVSQELKSAGPPRDSFVVLGNRLFRALGSLEP